jgi:hypothetical protein
MVSTSDGFGLCDTEPLLPVIVGVNTPCGAVRLALIVSVEVALAVIGFGLKLAVVPLGRPLMLRVTELEPLIAVALTTVVALEPPRVTERELGETERLKSVEPLPPPPTLKDPIAVLHR